MKQRIVGITALVAILVFSALAQAQSYEKKYYVVNPLTLKLTPVKAGQTITIERDGVLVEAKTEQDAAVLQGVLQMQNDATTLVPQGAIKQILGGRLTPAQIQMPKNIKVPVSGTLSVEPNGGTDIKVAPVQPKMPPVAPASPPKIKEETNRSVAPSYVEKRYGNPYYQRITTDNNPAPRQISSRPQYGFQELTGYRRAIYRSK